MLNQTNDFLIDQNIQLSNDYRSKPSMYDALSHPVDINSGHEPNLNIYRKGGEPFL